MWLKLAIAALWIISPPLWADENPHCFLACPTGAPETSTRITREAYTLSANGTTKFADWVAYRVTKDSIGPPRPRQWRPDPALDPALRLAPRDYRGAYAALGYDRGHLAPLASLSGLGNWAELNYLSNITPQNSTLNRGAWAALEAAVREVVQIHDMDAAHVMAGPLHEKPMPRLPNARSPHQTPSGYWKAITALKNGQVFTAAFIMGQDMAAGTSFCTSIAEWEQIEARTGLRLSRPDDNTGGEPTPLDALLGCPGE